MSPAILWMRGAYVQSAGAKAPIADRTRITQYRIDNMLMVLVVVLVVVELRSMHVAETRRLSWLLILWISTRAGSVFPSLRANTG